MQERKQIFVLAKLGALLFLSGCIAIVSKEVEKKIAEPKASVLESKREAFDFFEAVIGVTEAVFKKLSREEKKEFLSSDSTKLVNQKTGRQYGHGTFAAVSVGELREKAAKKEKKSNGVFNVIEGFDKPWESWFRDKVDVGALQADPKNRDAIFQVASNFNGLEGSGNPHAGLMNYLSPHLFVQGETAAISAAPGLIYRLYYVPHVVEGKTYYGQLEKQVELLGNFTTQSPPYIPVANGYVQEIPDINLFENLSNQDMDAYVQRIKVGYHHDIAVIAGLSKLKHEKPIDGRLSKWIKVDDPNQIIHQVFTAAMNPYGKKTGTVGYGNLARMLLKGAYEGTLNAAFVHDKKKVFLTLIGGGVFENKLVWISDTLVSAVDNIIKTTSLEINLVIYWSGAYGKGEWEQFKERLLKLTRENNGTYLRYKNDGVYEVTAK